MSFWRKKKWSIVRFSWLLAICGRPPSLANGVAIFPREWWIRAAIFPAAQRVQKRRNPTIAVVQILIRFLPTSLSFFLCVIVPSPTLSMRGRQFCKMRRLKCKSLIIQTKVDIGQETISQTEVQKLTSHFSQVQVRGLGMLRRGRGRARINRDDVSSSDSALGYSSEGSFQNQTWKHWSVT